MTTPRAPLDVLARAARVHDAVAVAAAYDGLAAAISLRLAGRTPLVLTLMQGGMIPAAEIARRLRFPFQLDYLHATRYRGATAGRELHWIARPSAPLDGRCVLLVDDILDEGVTLSAVRKDCVQHGADEVLAAVLVRKLHQRCTPGVHADFVGLEVPDRYVFGCGMDYKEWFRELPEIWAAAEEDA